MNRIRNAAAAMRQRIAPRDGGPRPGNAGLQKLRSEATEIRRLARELPRSEILSDVHAALDALCRSIEAQDEPIEAGSHRHEQMLSEARVLQTALDEAMPPHYGIKHRDISALLQSLHGEAFKVFDDLGGIRGIAPTPGQQIEQKLRDDPYLKSMFNVFPLKELASQLPASSAEFRKGCAELRQKILSMGAFNQHLVEGWLNLVGEIEQLEASMPGYLREREHDAVQGPVRLHPRTPVEMFGESLSGTFGADADALLGMLPGLPDAREEVNGECIRLFTMIDPRNLRHARAETLINDIWKFANNGAEMRDYQADRFARQAAAAHWAQFQAR